jgi:hypothetical protein
MRIASLLATICLFLPLTAPASAAPAGEVAALLSRIKGVGREGAGNEDAARAWKQLTQKGPGVLPDVLAAMDPAEPTASNWLRTAADAIAEKALARGKKLPADRLEAFVRDTRHAPAARRVAYEWLARIDKNTPQRLLPGMLHDPSVELRRDAVAARTEKAKRLLEAGKKEAATQTFREALSGAVDEDQVQKLARQLGELGVKVDVADHLGFIRSWYVITPFDNTNQKGFDVAYPPEKGVDLNASHAGKGGKKARWSLHSTDDLFGKLDLNKTVGKQKGVVAYACAVVLSPEERPVQIRVGSITSIKIFLNGKELFARDEYHHGMRMDQYTGVGKLNKGRNEVLIKVLQNEQEEDWAQNWVFQARLCDASGSAVPFELAPVMKDKTRTEKGER